jgi:hypothetical protein
MDPENYMKPFSASSEIHDAARPSLELNFPAGRGCRWLPPQLSLDQMIQRNRQLRQWFPAGLRTEEERWKAKTGVEFRL